MHYFFRNRLHSTDYYITLTIDPDVKSGHGSIIGDAESKNKNKIYGISRIAFGDRIKITYYPAAESAPAYPGFLRVVFCLSLR